MCIKIVNFARLTLVEINNLYKLYLTLVEEITKWSFAFLRMTKQYTTESIVASRYF